MAYVSYETWKPTGFVSAAPGSRVWYENYDEEKSDYVYTFVPLIGWAIYQVEVSVDDVVVATKDLGLQGAVLNQGSIRSALEATEDSDTYFIAYLGPDDPEPQADDERASRKRPKKTS